MHRLLKTAFISFLLIFLFQHTQAQDDWGVPVDEASKRIIYEEVVETEGVSKEELFKQAITWIDDFYTAGYKKIQSKDKEKGKILLKDRIVLFRVDKKTRVKDVLIDYKLELLFKDGRYKYRIYDFYHFKHSLSSQLEEWMESGYPDPELAKTRFTNLNIEMEKLIESMKASIGKEEEGDDGDW